MKSTIEREKAYLDVQEACQYLGINKSFMDRLTSGKKIKYAMFGGRKFRREWLDEYAERQTIDCVE